MIRCLSVLVLGLLTTAALHSQANADQMAAMMARIEQLERRVNELEAEKAARAPRPAAAPLSPAAAHEHGGHLSVSAPVENGGEGHPALRLAGFTDVNFSSSDQKGARSGFQEGQFILHVTSALSRKVNYFGELSFTARADAGLGSPAASGFNMEVERSIIRYDQNDAFKMSFGRYHTPINFWNTAYHHGSWLQTTVGRPEMVQFGGAFLPVHFIGALTEGTVPAGGLNLTYNAGAGNGRGTTLTRGGDFGDVNNNRAWLLNAFVRPDGLHGIQMGASLYRDKITLADAPAAREWIEAFHIVREKENPEIIAEFANVTHRPVGGGGAFHHQAGYVQVAYRLPAFEGKLKPYYRYEHIHIAKSDPVFRNVRGLSASTAGIRYDISSFSALKFEYQSVDRPGAVRSNVGIAQTSFTF
jgi:hypothetical protein